MSFQVQDIIFFLFPVKSSTIKAIQQLVNYLLLSSCTMFPLIMLLLLPVLIRAVTLQRPHFTSFAPTLFMYCRTLFWVKQEPMLH